MPSTISDLFVDIVRLRTPLVSPPRVLLVDDHQSIRDQIRQSLQAEGYECVCAADGQRGFELAMTRPFDLVLLDVMLPAIDGISICRAIRNAGTNGHVPIMIVTARGGERDKVLGFESGADDYLTKPFSMHELMVRIAALMRRARRLGSQSQFGVRAPVAMHGIQINGAKRRVRVRGKNVALTSREFELLYLLASNPGVVFTRQRLLDCVWGDSVSVAARNVDNIVKHLRCKIEEDPPSPRLILTVWKYGYKFADA